MLDGITRVRGAYYKYKVKLRLERHIRLDPAHENIGGSHESPLLFGVDALTWIYITVCARLYFDEYQPVILAGYEIDLHPAYLLVFMAYGIAKGEQMLTGHLLSPFA